MAKSKHNTVVSKAVVILTWTMIPTCPVDTHSEYKSNPSKGHFFTT